MTVSTHFCSQDKVQALPMPHARRHRECGDHELGACYLDAMANWLNVLGPKIQFWNTKKVIIQRIFDLLFII